MLVKLGQNQYNAHGRINEYNDLENNFATCSTHAPVHAH